MPPPCLIRAPPLHYLILRRSLSHLLHAPAQATDADGAYVGIVTPLAKLSSYPGADAHSVGWRAKGGLRHKHGSTVEAASLAWGQGDRVGLRLDTDQCSLTLYKNGEALTTNQLLPVSFAEAGARFCIGRYYGTVEMCCAALSSRPRLCP